MILYLQIISEYDMKSKDKKTYKLDFMEIKNLLHQKCNRMKKNPINYKKTSCSERGNKSDLTERNGIDIIKHKM